MVVASTRNPVPWLWLPAAILLKRVLQKRNVRSTRLKIRVTLDQVASLFVRILLKLIPISNRAVTLVPSRVDLSIGYGPLDGTLIFVSMTAVGKTALVNERPDVAKVPGDLFRDDVPQLHLPDARRVDQVTFSIQRLLRIVFAFFIGILSRDRKWNQLSRRCRVASFLIFRADGADSQLQTRFDRVEDRALSYATLPRHNTVAAMNQSP